MRDFDYDGNLYFLDQRERQQYPPAVIRCSVCGDDINDGDWAYRPFGKVMCAGCLEEVKFVAEAFGTESCNYS